MDMVRGDVPRVSALEELPYVSRSGREMEVSVVGGGPGRSSSHTFLSREELDRGGMRVEGSRWVGAPSGGSRRWTDFRPGGKGVGVSQETGRHLCPTSGPSGPTPGRTESLEGWSRTLWSYFGARIGPQMFRDTRYDGWRRQGSYGRKHRGPETFQEG